MIFYTVFAVLFSAWIIILTVWDLKPGKEKTVSKCDRWTAVGGLILFVCGTAGVAVSYFTCADRELAAWVKDTVFTYSYVFVPVFMLLFAVGIITVLASARSTVLRKKAVHKLRIIMIAVSSLFLICLNYLAFIGENEKLPLAVCLAAIGAGLSSVMRFAALTERKIYISGDNK